MAKWAERETSGIAPRHAEHPATDLATLVAESLPEGGRAVLAVSGGLDSMSLLDVAAGVRYQRGCKLIVATFDHASGEYSERATALVARVALEYGLETVVGRAPAETPQTEAAWRAARWSFLRSVALEIGGPVITAHTRDDQVETVLMRAMRGAGARGLAGLRAPASVRRPLLEVRRTELRAYAEARMLEWIDDPTNESRRFFRNRLRHDLLPALARVRPTIADDLIAIGERASSWREELARLVDARIRFTVRRDDEHRASLDVSREDLARWSDDELGIVWPELAARAGVVLDRRGTVRAVRFTRRCRTGGRIQLSGAWELVCAHDWLELRASCSAANEKDNEPLLETGLRWKRWRFSILDQPAGQDPWCAELGGGELRVRSWRPGDRLMVRRGDQLVGRKVKYFLADAKISGHIRASWPVVLAGDEIVWIPGVRRSDAATARSGRPVVTYVCDYLDRRP